MKKLAEEERTQKSKEKQFERAVKAREQRKRKLNQKREERERTQREAEEKMLKEKHSAREQVDSVIPEGRRGRKVYTINHHEL